MSAIDPGATRRALPCGRADIHHRSSATRATVFEELGAANNDNGAWASASVNLNAFAGQSVQLVVEAADASTASLVEAAIDNVVVKR